MAESTQATPKTRNVRIRSMAGRHACGGFFIAEGAKLKPEDVCLMPATQADEIDGSDYIEFTNKSPNCELVHDGKRWVIERESDNG